MSNKRYRPSNGSEGEWFIAEFCGECARDTKWQHGLDGGTECDILSRSFIFDVDEEGFPDEWTYDQEGRPTCTAFLPLGSQLPTDTDLEALGQINLLLDP